MKRADIALNMTNLMGLFNFQETASYKLGFNTTKLNRKNKGCSGYNGQRERDRRRRQIAKGQLKKENGLVV